MKRIIVHWTAGSHRASALDRKHYHFIFEGDGKEVAGVHPVSANERPVSGKYAAHTLRCNTGSIGLSMACMAGATEKNFGRFPMTEAQFEAMAEKAADLAIQYGIPITDKTILSHAEVEKNLGIKQRGKWDFTVLPFRTDLKGAKACGNYFRQRVRDYIEIKTAPPMVSLPEVPGAVEDILNDHDKGVFGSTTNMASMVSGGAGAIGTAGGVLGYIESPVVQIVLILVIAAGVAWVLRERSRKAREARAAKALL